MCHKSGYNTGAGRLSHWVVHRRAVLSGEPTFIDVEQDGTAMQLIARLVGHSRMDTTVGYTHTDLDTLSKAVASLNHNPNMN